jgi:hypothetical protein
MPGTLSAPPAPSPLTHGIPLRSQRVRAAFDAFLDVGLCCTGMSTCTCFINRAIDASSRRSSADNFTDTFGSPTGAMALQILRCGLCQLDPGL